MKNDPYKTTFHRDRTITVWDVYAQGWTRVSVDAISDRVMASLSDSERRRITRMQEAK